MPYQANANVIYATNTTGNILLHGQAIAQPLGAGWAVGVAIKQIPAHWSDGLTAQNQIQVGEPYAVLRRGVVEIPDTGQGWNDGDLVYIAESNSTLVKSATGAPAGSLKFGRVVEVANDSRGVPVGFARVNLDERETF
jgi:predicted RecA/RadA family phage recombinase